MSGVNQVVIAGGVTRDPELRHTQSGTAICRLNVATSRKYKQNEEWQEETAYHSVTVWGKQGEQCAKHLTKGSKVTITGRLKYGSYEKDGIKHYTTDIVAEDVVFQSSPRERGGRQQGYDDGGYDERGRQDSHRGGGFRPSVPEEDDIPF